MDTSLVIAAVAAVAVGALVVGVVFAFLPGYRDRRLREQFGPEFEYLVHEHGGPRAARREMTRRTRRRARLTIRDLAAPERRAYVHEWQGVQVSFADGPAGAVRDAEALLTRVMADRGYPADPDPEQRVADLSVDHPHVVGHYRRARAIIDAGATSTEELRVAMVHLRTLASVLLDHDLGAGPSGAEQAADRSGPPAQV